MINTTQFRIIGRIGTVSKLENVTYVSFATDRRTKGTDGEWKTETNWVSVTAISSKIRNMLENNRVAKQGNLVVVEGSIQSSSFKKNDDIVFATSLVVDEFQVLSFANDKS